jgi:hypothetical protein
MSVTKKALQKKEDSLLKEGSFGSFSSVKSFKDQMESLIAEDKKVS